jgi:hypothetical protein
VIDSPSTGSQIQNPAALSSVILPAAGKFIVAGNPGFLDNNTPRSVSANALDEETTF